MSKWLIPRHMPRRTSDDLRGDVNHGKVHRVRKGRLIQREIERKKAEYDTYKQLADDGIEVAKVVLGTCNRKKSLDLAQAKRCALAVWLETGRRVWVYECHYCGKCHITTHPVEGNRYVYSTQEFEERMK